MTLTFDIADDLLLVDGLDTLTLKVTGQADVVLSECVVSEPIDVKETEPTGGQVIQTDTLFVWPVARCTQPPLGSVLVDEDGTYWTILAVRRKQHVDTWEARCRNLSIVTGDDNVATILKAGYGHGNAGEALAVWKGAVSGALTPTSADQVSARFQPSKETARILFGSEFTETTYRVLFKTPVPIELAGGQYRLVDSDGYRYRVVDYQNEERIDKLPVAIAVRITEGAEYHDRVVGA